MPNALLHFTVTATADGFELRVEDDRGQALETFATEEQLDVIAEELNRQLDALTVDEEDLDEEGRSDGEER